MELWWQRKPPQVCRMGVGAEEHTDLVICLSGGNNAAGLDDSPHLLQNTDGIIDVLQHLMTGDDVERIVRKGQLIAVDLLKRHIAQPSGLRILGRLLEHRLDRVSADDSPLRD